MEMVDEIERVDCHLFNPLRSLVGSNHSLNTFNGVQMAKAQRNIPESIKHRLIDEAGGKCANPGCTNTRTQNHHIRQWAVYKAHEVEHMIAVCPSCHDSCHHGKLKIPDEALYEWKGIQRNCDVQRGSIYIEPDVEFQVILGTVKVKSANKKLTLFRLHENCFLEVSLLDDEYLQVSLRICTLSGNESLRVSRNNVKSHDRNKLSLIQRPGRIQITTRRIDQYLAPQVQWMMANAFPEFSEIKELVVLNIEVVRPGVIKVEGVWVTPVGSVVISDGVLSFCNGAGPLPISLSSTGKGSILFTGSPETPLFALG